jgi:hypothetical protein
MCCVFVLFFLSCGLCCHVLLDASYQVSVHLAKKLRRRLKCEKLTDDRRRMPSDGKSSCCLWQGELKRQLCEGPSNDQSCTVWVYIKFVILFIGSNVKTVFAVPAI